MSAAPLPAAPAAGAPVARPARRIGCLTLLALGIALLLAPFVALWAWSVTDFDLRAVAAAPGGWPPAVPVALEQPDPPPGIAAYAELVQRFHLDGAVMAPPPPGEPLSASLVAWQRGMPVELWDGLRRAVPLAAVGAATRPATYGNRARPEFHLLSAVAARIACRGTERWTEGGPELAELVALGAALAAGEEPHSPVARAYTLSATELLVAALTHLLAERPAELRAAGVAAPLRELRARLWAARASVEAGAAALRRADTRVWGFGPGYDHDFGWSGLAESLRMGLVQRVNRAASLREARDRWRAHAGATTLAELWRRADAVPVADRGPARLVTTNFHPVHGWFWFLPVDERVARQQHDLVRTLLALDVLGAELDAADAGAVRPPEDPYDPAHGSPAGRLRPVMRDGRRIGWYSVGPDGRDDGGDAANDLGFATDGALGGIRLGD